MKRWNKFYKNYNSGNFEVLENFGKLHGGGSSEIYIVTGKFIPKIKGASPI